MKFFPAIRSSAEEFRREAAAMRQRHPNVVALLDAGVHEDGAPYLVMEYVPGRDARTLLEEGTPPSDLAFRIGTQVFRALDAIHRAGLVHGDIKPENVRLQGDLARVVDFGRARLRHLFGTSSIFPGTPPYMLPSLFRGGAPSPRSDCFATWVMIYELLVGYRPFGQGQLKAADDGALPPRRPLPDPLWERLVEAGLTGVMADARSSQVALERFLGGHPELPWQAPPAPRVEARFIQQVRAELDGGRSLALVGDAEMGRVVLESLDRLWATGGGRTLWARAEWLPPGTPLAGALSLAVQVSDSLSELELEEVAAALGPLGGALAAAVPATRAWLPSSPSAETRPASERLALALRRMIGACPRPLLLLVDGLDRLDGSSRRFFTSLVAEGEVVLVGTTRPAHPHGMPTELELPSMGRLPVGEAHRLTPQERTIHGQAMVLGLPIGETLARALAISQEEIREVALACEAAGAARYNGVEVMPRDIGATHDPDLAESWFRDAARRLNPEREALLVARYALAAKDGARLGEVIDRAVEEALRADPGAALDLLRSDPLPPDPARILRHFQVALVARDRATAVGLLERLREMPGVSPADVAEAESDLLFQEGKIQPTILATRRAAAALGVEPRTGAAGSVMFGFEILRMFLGLRPRPSPNPQRARIFERLHDLHFLSDNADMLHLHRLWWAAAPRDYRARAMEVVWQSVLGRREEALRLEADLLAEGEEERNPVASAVVILHRGIARLSRGDTVEAFSDGVEAVDRLLRVGDPYLASLAGTLVWTAGLHLGTTVTMRRIAEGLRKLSLQTDDPRGLAWVEGGEGVICWMEGKYDAALGHTRAWAESAAGRGENTETLARRLLGDILLDAGQPAEAAEQLMLTVRLISRYHLQLDFVHAVWISLQIADARLRRLNRPGIPGRWTRTLRIRWLVFSSPRWLPRALAAEAWQQADPQRARELFDRAETEARLRHMEWDAEWVRRQREAALPAAGAAAPLS